MKKLKLAIIGQGRSGRDIHGAYCRSERNLYFDVGYVVDFDERRRRQAEETLYPGCKTFSDYRDLFDVKDIDLVVNTSYSQMHFDITKDLIEHGFNVLTEKPFARNTYECETLIKLAKEKGVVLAVFHNTQPAPFYLHARKLINDGVLGSVKQVSIRYNSFSRRWDWQTLQKYMGGSAYNTGPHPIAMGLGFLDFDKNTKVVYSRADRALTSGDAEDYVKILLTAPDKPLVDIEINSTDAFSNYCLKIQGSKGTLKSTQGHYDLKYVVDGENPGQPVREHFLEDENGNPLYCSEKLIMHEESGDYEGTAFDLGSAAVYENVYRVLTENAELGLSLENAAMVINVIETLHAENPLSVEF